jgi:hypothetical protein
MAINQIKSSDALNRASGIRGWKMKMTNHPNRNRRFYAAQSPRGFANEILVHVFETRAARDAWVAEHEDDGGVNSASQGAYTITSKRAKEILAYPGDAITHSYNGAVEH